MNLPRIRRDGSRKQQEEFEIPAILVGFPNPGVGVVVDLYQRWEGDWLVFPVTARW